MEEALKSWLSNPAIGRFIAVAVGILIVVLLVRFVKASIARYVREVDARYRARKFFNFIGYIAAVLIIAAVYSENLRGLTVTLGVAGAGIAFALQEVIASFAGWFAISFASFYKTGDRVQLGGIRGDVIDIGILRTTLMEVGEWVKGDLYSGRVVRIANSFVFKEPVFNYSGDFPFLWDEISIPVKYGSDHRLTRQILERVAAEVLGDYIAKAEVAWQQMLKSYLIEHARIEPMITLTANDNWMEFTLRYAVDFKMRRTTKDLLFTRILDEFARTDGRVAIASATLHIVEAPAIDVRLKENPVKDSMDEEIP